MVPLTENSRECKLVYSNRKLGAVPEGGSVEAGAGRAMTEGHRETLGGDGGVYCLGWAAGGFTDICQNSWKCTLNYAPMTLCLFDRSRAVKKNEHNF